MEALSAALSGALAEALTDAYTTDAGGSDAQVAQRSKPQSSRPSASAALRHPQPNSNPFAVGDGELASASKCSVRSNAAQSQIHGAILTSSSALLASLSRLARLLSFFRSSLCAPCPWRLCSLCLMCMCARACACAYARRPFVSLSLCQQQRQGRNAADPRRQGTLRSVC